MDERKLPYLRIFVADEIADTVSLNDAELGSYFSLRMMQWRNHGLPLADDDVRLARMARCSLKVWKSGGRRAAMEPLFRVANGVWWHDDITAEWAEAQKRSEAGRAGGLASAEARRDEQKPPEGIQQQPHEGMQQNPPAGSVEIGKPLNSNETGPTTVDASLEQPFNPLSSSSSIASKEEREGSLRSPNARAPDPQLDLHVDGKDNANVDDNDKANVEHKNNTIDDDKIEIILPNGSAAPRAAPPKPTRRASDAELEIEFEEWWSYVEHKVAKAFAAQAFKRARRKVELHVLIDGQKRYVETKPADQKPCNPATWLNGERWLDEPAHVLDGGSRRKDALDVLERYGRGDERPRPEDVADALGNAVYELEAERPGRDAFSDINEPGRRRGDSKIADALGRVVINRPPPHAAD